ncbi:MAG: hypothetical protein J7539_10885 [Niabella sp.]|nr:hypothetical protein [Niabella sp.]
MFSILTTYLYQHKKLALPGIGNFELQPKSASVSFDTVAAPGWDIIFSENKSVTAADNPDSFYELLGAKESLSGANAQQQFEEFARNLVVKLNDNERIDWEDVGVFEKPDYHIHFTPKTPATSLFNNVTAQRVIREHADHQLLVGEKETTKNAALEQMLWEERSNKRKTITWIIVGAVAVIAAVFFLKNGCAAGNQQPVAAQKPAATYKLK